MSSYSTKCSFVHYFTQYVVFSDEKSIRHFDNHCQKFLKISIMLFVYTQYYLRLGAILKHKLYEE